MFPTQGHTITVMHQKNTFPDVVRALPGEYQPFYPAYV